MRVCHHVPLDRHVLLHQPFLSQRCAALLVIVSTYQKQMPEKKKKHCEGKIEEIQKSSMQKLLVLIISKLVK